MGTAAAGCGETKYDVYLKGLEVEGEASRGACKLEYADNSQQGSMASAATLSGDQVASCLKATEDALGFYERAAAMGYRGPEFDQTYERAKARKDRLTSMLRIVRDMERDAIEVPGT